MEERKSGGEPFSRSPKIFSFLSLQLLCSLSSQALLGWGYSSVGRSSYRYAAHAGSILRCGKRFFPPSQLQCRLSYGVRTPPCAITCIYIYAHVKDPVVHVRVRWTMGTLKHPAYTVGWVARLCHSWLSNGKVT